MDRDIYGRATRLDTWIDRRLVSIDLDRVWGDTFCKWDGLVPTDCAAAIATATEDILRAEAEAQNAQPSLAPLVNAIDRMAASFSIAPTSEPTNG